MRGIIYISCFILLSRATLAQSDVCAPEDLRASIVEVLTHLDSTRFDDFNALYITSAEATALIDGFDISEEQKERFYKEVREEYLDSVRKEVFRQVLSAGELVGLNWQQLSYEDFLYRLRIKRGMKQLKGEIFMEYEGRTNDFRLEAVLVNGSYRIMTFDFTPREMYESPYSIDSGKIIEPQLKEMPPSTTQEEIVVVEPMEVETAIVDFPDREAEYPGGAIALQQFIRETIVYPQEAIQRGEQGKVFLRFIVDESGKIRDLKVMRGVSAVLDREAKRVIRAMPDWIPAEKDGKPVATNVNIPIAFSLP